MRCPKFPFQVILFTTLTLAAILLVPSARARAHDTHAGPGLILEMPGEPQLARRSVVGPSMELTSGIVLIGATPFVAFAVGMAAGPEWWVSCGDDDHPDEACERRQRNEQRRGRNWALAVSAPLLAGGAFLVGHGARRVRQIRIARRHLSMADATLDVARGGASLGLSFRF